MKLSFLNAGLLFASMLASTANATNPVTTKVETNMANPDLAADFVLIAPYKPVAHLNLLGQTLAAPNTDWDPTSIEAWAAKNRKYAEFYFGWNQWRNGDGQASQDPVNLQTTELNGWNSMTWGFGFGTRSRIGEGKLGIRYGLQFNWHFYRFEKNNTLLVKNTAQGTEGISFVDDPSPINYKKSSYRNTYLDLPILIDIDLRKSESKGLTLAFGGYGGVRLGTSTKVKFSDGVGDDVKTEMHDPNFTNLWRYGLMGQVGFGAFKVTGKMDLNTVFEQDNLSTPDYQVASITIGWVVP